MSELAKLSFPGGCSLLYCINGDIGSQSVYALSEVRPYNYLALPLKVKHVTLEKNKPGQMFLLMTRS